jgi:chemotaxis methyl-accepting protein methylase
MKPKPRSSGEKKHLDPDAAMGGLIHGLMRAQGMDLSMYDEAFLRQTLTRRMSECGFTSAAAYGDDLIDHREAAEGFLGALRIAHSEFFRNPLTFALLEQSLLPNLIAEHRQSGHGEVRVWSAGCAAGQEAWSVAILLEELNGEGVGAVPYRIFATDRSAGDLVTARAGVYSVEALGNVRTRQLRDYFTRRGESFVIHERLRPRVDFSVYDLLDEDSSCPDASIYGDFDLIFCCNLLFYYRVEVRQRILAKLCRVLAPGGYFVTGEVERDSVNPQNGLRPVAAGFSVFQKPKIRSFP